MGLFTRVSQMVRGGLRPAWDGGWVEVMPGDYAVHRGEGRLVRLGGQSWLELRVPAHTSFDGRDVAESTHFFRLPSINKISPISAETAHRYLNRHAGDDIPF